MRRLYIVLIALGVLVVFVVVSGLLARVWSSDGAETSALTALVKAEARGDDAAAVAGIRDCQSDPLCRARVQQNVTALRHPGHVSIILINPSTGFSLTSTIGTARVAWAAGGSLPVVQCVRVRHAGNVLSGIHVELLKVSLRIKSDAPCPARY